MGYTHETMRDAKERGEKALLDEKYAGVQSIEFEKDVNRLERGEPVAYVIGWVPFLGLRIYLDSRPLIPRPETEWWAEQLIEKLAGASREFRVLDLCAGSGAIGLAVLSKIQDVHVSFSDIEPRHVATIEKNIRENNLDRSRADIRSGDLFAPFEQNELFDVIVANPPYVPETRSLPSEVKSFEPREALYSGAEGLDLIERIARETPSHLFENGMLWLECDSEHAAQALTKIQEFFHHATLENDLYGRPRLIKAHGNRVG